MSNSNTASNPHLALPVDYSAQVQHAALKKWVSEMVALAQPHEVYWCDGSEEEYNLMCRRLVAAGTFIPLNAEKRPTAMPAFLTPAMWLVSRTAPTSARNAKKTPVLPTIGWTPPP